MIYLTIFRYTYSLSGETEVKTELNRDRCGLRPRPRSNSDLDRMVYQKPDRDRYHPTLLLTISSFNTSHTLGFSLLWTSLMVLDSSSKKIKCCIIRDLIPLSPPGSNQFLAHFIIIRQVTTSPTNQARMK